MDNNGSGPSSPEEFRQITQKVVELPTLRKRVVIRQLIGLDYLEAGTLPLISVDLKPEERKTAVREKLKADPALQLRVYKAILVNGVIKPRIVDVDPADCPPDAITVHALGADLEWLVAEIQMFSGLTQEAARAAGPFPAGAGSATS